MYFFYAIFAALPSIIWLGFYLRHDSRPEPKKMVLGIFVIGILAAIAAIFIEKGATSLYYYFLKINPKLFFFLYVFLGIGLSEELLKYLAVRVFALRHRELDEPFDVVLYLIIAALGFVTLENFLKFLHPNFLPSPQETIISSFVLMITSVLLHTIASGILGCFIACGYYKHKFKVLIIIFGIIFVTLLHGFYDFSIIKAEGALKYASMAGLLIFMTALFWIFMHKVRKFPSICK